MSELGLTLKQLRKINSHNDRTVETPVNPIGIKTPLERGTREKETLFKMHFDIATQIKDNLKNLIMTQKGERLGFPDFGTSLRQIYSNNTLSKDEIVDIASEEIKEVVLKYMPSIRLEEFYSSKVDNQDQKSNYSNKAGRDFSSSSNSNLNFEETTFREININNIEIDSIYEIKIKYSIPILNKKQELILRINSSL